MLQNSADKLQQKMLQQVDIFISSPGDVAEERQIVLRVITRLNRMHAIAQRYLLKPLTYEYTTPAIVGQKPQTVVDHYMLESDRADIFICILWHRMGTAVIDEKTHEIFQSGTEYEFFRAYKANQQYGIPHMLLYRCIKSLPSNTDLEQLQRVQVFFNRFEGENADLRGLYKTYQTSEELENTLFHDLDSVISRNLIETEKIVSGSASTLDLIQRDISYADMGEAPAITVFYGREQELTTIKQWMIEEHCRIVALSGIGGIGKTSLATTVVEQTKQDFTYLFWRSLYNAPSIESVLHDCIQFVSNHQYVDLPEDIDSKITLLIKCLQEKRCLLILDNFESVLQEGSRAGQYRSQYEMYGRLLQRLGTEQHQSCLLLTSRERPKEIALLQGNISFVRSLQITGLGQREGQAILRDKGLFGVDEVYGMLIQLYSGNPLALKFISEPIRELFGGDISEFLKEEEMMMEDIYALLEQQFKRLSELEREIMYWLAIEREPVSLNQLRKNITHTLSKKKSLETLDSLHRKSMIETRGVGLFTL